MWRVVVLLGVIAIAAGVAVAGGFGSDEVEPPPPVARRADVVCASEGTLVLTDRVQPLRDGVHVRVVNPSRAELLEIRSATDEVLAEMPVAFEGASEATFALPPGPTTVTCTTGPGVDADGSAILTVVDAEGRWVSPDLPCSGDAERATYVVDLIETERARSTARRAVPTIRSSDVLASPGYPGSLWHGDLLVVIREGQPVAQITRAQDAGTWNVFVEACPGTAIATA